MITGLTELVPNSFTRRTTLKNGAKIKRNVQQLQDPFGAIYPGILRRMYDIPFEYLVHPNSSFGVAEFEGDNSYSQQDLQSFNLSMDENVVVSQIVGPFYTGSEPDDESTLDVQVSVESEVHIQRD